MTYLLILLMCLAVGLLATYTIMKLPKAIHKAEEDLHEAKLLNTPKKESKIEYIVDVLGGYLYAAAAAAVVLMLYGAFLMVDGTPYDCLLYTSPSPRDS